MSAKREGSEFNRPVRGETVGDREVGYEIEADAEERAALARRFALLALDRLAATVSLRRPGEGKSLRARVSFAADVVQSCVVTLDPVPDHIEESFEVVYVPEREAGAGATEEVLNVDDVEPPEVMVDGLVDIGEALAEHLALALEPYPRKAGVSVEDVPRQGGTEPEENPFAILRRLKARA